MLQINYHSSVLHQTYTGILVKYHKNVHIRVFVLLATCIRTKEPCFQNGLRLEIFSYQLCHCLSAHTLAYFRLQI